MRLLLDELSDSDDDHLLGIRPDGTLIQFGPGRAASGESSALGASPPGFANGLSVASTAQGGFTGTNGSSDSDAGTNRTEDRRERAFGPFR